MPELLIPARDPETLRVAVLYGADAVYIGGERLSLRAKAGNFTLPEMAESAAFAHERGVKVYVAANVFARDGDIAAARELLPAYAAAGADGFIISDPGMFRAARECAPEVSVHISTQANNTNAETWRFWYDLGVKRLVAARELSLAELRKIRAEIPEDMEIECFVHGAMCISYSGRCLLSNYFTGRDANRGACTHPCRWKYAVMEESRPGVYLPVEENERGTFVFNSRDLCMIDHIPDLIAAGVDSFKIEGRMKTALYVASVGRAYRQAIDDLAESEELYRSRIPEYMDAIRKCTYRRFTTGFYYGRPDAEAMVYDSNTYVNEAVFLGIIEEITPEGRARIMQRNKFSVGDRIEIMKPDGRDIPVTVGGMYNEEGVPVQSAPHPRQVVDLVLVPEGSPDTAAETEPGDILRAVTGGEPA